MSAQRFERKRIEATAFGVSAALDPVGAGILGGPGQVPARLVGELSRQPSLTETNDRFGSTMFGAQQMVYGAILMLLIPVMTSGIGGLVAGARKPGWTGSRSAVPGTGKADTMQKVAGQR